MKKAIDSKKARVWEVDFFRGLAILLVIWDHAMVDLTIFYHDWQILGVDWLVRWGQFGYYYLFSEVRFFWRPVFLFIFFMMSGLSTAFSKNNLIRGLKLLGVSVVVSLLTYVLSSWTGGDYFILFGVLHCIAIIILIYTATVFLIETTIRLIFKICKKQYNKKIYDIAVSIICIVLSLVFYYIHQKFNVSLYEQDSSQFFLQTNSKILGLFFYVSNWSSADYFPLFPFISFFFLGAGLAKLLYPQRKTLLPSIDNKWHKIFTIPGRYSLAIYLAIQIVLFAFFALVTYIASGVFII